MEKDFFVGRDILGARPRLNCFFNRHGEERG
jgi:hypothetical protein